MLGRRATCLVWLVVSTSAVSRLFKGKSACPSPQGRIDRPNFESSAEDEVWTVLKEESAPQSSETDTKKDDSLMYRPDTHYSSDELSQVSAVLFIYSYAA